MLRLFAVSRRGVLRARFADVGDRGGGAGRAGGPEQVTP
jgi:hypothetical protein